MNLTFRTITMAVSIFFASAAPVGPHELVSPIPEKVVTEQVEITPSPTPAPEKQAGIVGKASYYSREGCIGCSESLTMANGQPLDDTALTVAYNRAPLNSYVTVTNTKTNQSVVAKVTDTGGFERHGKIIDLTIATRDAIGCGHVCDVQIVDGATAHVSDQAQALEESEK